MSSWTAYILASVPALQLTTRVIRTPFGRPSWRFRFGMRGWPAAYTKGVRSTYNGEMTEPTYNMQPTSLAITGTYYPLRFRIGPIAKERVRTVAAAILGGYLGQDVSYSKWRDAGEFVVTWNDEKEQAQNSKSFSFDDLCDHLTTHERFVPAEMNLPPVRLDWLDTSIEIKQPFHAPANERQDDSLTFMLASPLGDKFPIHPKIDREGRAFSSLQGMLLQSWLDLRTRLVEQSNQLFEGYDWLRDLFMYLNTVVSAVDNTLHQIYYRAKYQNSTPGWTFDERKLGPATARRLKDKLSWVGQITGQPLDDCTAEVAQFVQLKDVRNHIAHFDPPAFAFTIEDVARWLNGSFAVAKLLWAVRKRVAQPMSSPLIALLLAREVDWYPRDAGMRRVPQRPDTGYASSCWQYAAGTDTPTADSSRDRHDRP